MPLAMHAAKMLPGEDPEKCPSWQDQRVLPFLEFLTDLGVALGCEVGKSAPLVTELSRGKHVSENGAYWLWRVDWVNPDEQTQGTFNL